MLLKCYFEKFYGIMVDDIIKEYANSFYHSLERPFTDVQAELAENEPENKILLNINSILYQNTKKFEAWIKSPNKYSDYDKCCHIYMMQSSDINRLINKTVTMLESTHVPDNEDNITTFQSEILKDSLWKVVNELKFYVDSHKDDYFPTTAAEHILTSENVKINEQNKIQDINLSGQKIDEE